MYLPLIEQLRNQVVPSTGLSKLQRKDFYEFLGQSMKEKIAVLGKRVLPGNERGREERYLLFQYIIKYWIRSTFDIPYGMPVGKGNNLAKHPFLVPSGLSSFFQEQYRWDTRFQNLGLIIAGGNNLCIGQLQNLIDVYNAYKRIPNALTTEFLSHAQPPLETTAVFDILAAGEPVSKWSDDCIETASQELFTEWLDLWEDKKHPRMTNDLVSKYGFLSRYTNIHFHALLVGCEDGKDHNWISAKFGENYIPVQLNAIIYKAISDIILYYQVYRHNEEKSLKYKVLQRVIYDDFHKLLWHDDGIWRGFFNYAINLTEKKKFEGPIFFDDLASYIFPLWAGLCTSHEASVLVDAIEKYFACPNGLLTCSALVREGAIISKEAFETWEFQWDYPNMWPPLMQIAIEGLLRYGFYAKAISYMQRWIYYLEQTFYATGAFYEKYSKDIDSEIAGGFYGVEKGFGWTIGTYLWMLHKLDSLNQEFHME